MFLLVLSIFTIPHNLDIVAEIGAWSSITTVDIWATIQVVVIIATLKFVITIVTKEQLISSTSKNVVITRITTYVFIRWAGKLSRKVHHNLSGIQ
jgi:hypothetical protein